MSDELGRYATKDRMKTEQTERKRAAMDRFLGRAEQPAVRPAGLAGEVRIHAIAIGYCAARLNALREAWLNPPEWTERVPEVVPHGMASSPYPDRIVARPGFERELAKRTLTALYNERPQWLDDAHKALDIATARAYGWTDYTPDMPEEEILRRLLKLNQERAAVEQQAGKTAELFA